MDRIQFTTFRNVGYLYSSSMCVYQIGGSVIVPCDRSLCLSRSWVSVRMQNEVILKINETDLLGRSKFYQQICLHTAAFDQWTMELLSVQNTSDLPWSNIRLKLSAERPQYTILSIRMDLLFAVDTIVLGVLISQKNQWKDRYKERKRSNMDQMYINQYPYSNTIYALMKRFMLRLTKGWFI